MKEKNPIFEYVKKLERGEKIPLRRTKMRAPYKEDGSVDYDNAEIVEVTYE